MMIHREDMLELTRRMSDQRTHLARIAGAYLDEEGYVDGTFNTNFLNLKGAEKKHCLDIAKAVPFSRTNEELREFAVPGMIPGSIWQLLYALRDCELKNDALLLSLYEYIGENYVTGLPYAIYVYYGCYDIPVKAEDKTRLDESEEVYRYLLLAICPQGPDNTALLPDAGFLYPTLHERSADFSHVNVFNREENSEERAMLKKLLLLN